MSDIIAYHFTSNALRDGSPLPRIGETLVHDGPLTLCKSGLHASIHPFDSLYYAPGPLLHRVRMSGEIVAGGDKIVASERTILASIDATDLLREFACWCALSVIHLWDAPDTVRQYLETGDKSSRAEAREAARAAARAVALAAEPAAWVANAAARAVALAADAAARGADAAAWAADAATRAANAADAAAWAADAAAWAADAAAWAAWAADAATRAANAAAWAANAAARAAARAAVREAQRAKFATLVDAAFAEVESE